MSATRDGYNRDKGPRTLSFKAASVLDLETWGLGRRRDTGGMNGRTDGILDRSGIEADTPFAGGENGMVLTMGLIGWRRRSSNRSAFEF
jgi:hypothetical protein